MIDENKLKIIWRNIKYIPGYQHILLLCGLTHEELDLMDEWENEEAEIIKEAEEYYNRIELPKVKEQDREFVKEMMESDEIKDIRLMYIEKQKEELQNLIAKAYQHNKEMKAKFVNPFTSLDWLRIAIMDLWKLPEMEKQLKKVLFEYRVLKYKGEIKEGIISEFMIVKAKEFPMEQLIEVNGRGFALCPFHSEKTPSFYVKNNWGFCFSCGKSVDTIQLLIDRDNMSFVEAVEKLQ